MSGRYYRALSVMHQRVQGNIDDLERSLQPDWMRVSELKRLRLSIKDRMKSILKESHEAHPQGSLPRSARRRSPASTLGSDA